LEKLKAEKKKEQIKEATFTPRINSYSRFLSQRPTELPETQLLEREEKLQKKKERLRADKEKQMKKICTFTPKLGGKTINLATKKRMSRSFASGERNTTLFNKSLDESLFQSLYLEASSLNTRRSDLQSRK
jgi:hypothetical protein